MLQDGAVLPYVYRVTKYDPADRDQHGHYIGAQGVVSDRGEYEAAYLQAVAAFAADAGLDRLVVREPGIPSFVHFGAAAAADDHGLGALFPDGLHGFHDGAEVQLAIALELVRGMLRDSGAWCRLEADGIFEVHVGWDQYLYVSTSRPSADAVARTRALGLFPESLDASPYAMETGLSDVQRPADAEFWSALAWAVDSGRAGLLEETYIEGASRWHPLSGDTLDAVRAGLAPRARLAVWPALSPDVGAVLGSLPDEGLVEGVWQDTGGRVHSAVADEEDYAELTMRMAGAAAAALMPMNADERVPLFTAVLPDSDGVVRARWRTDPTPDDRKWAFLKSLRPGQVVTGRVTETASFGVTFVDIEGHEGFINIPELTWRPVAHPSDVVSVGQRIHTQVLGVDTVRGRLALSFKALHDDPMKQLTGRVGTTILGPVTKIVPFGVFVRIEERENGLEGLVHNSELTGPPGEEPQFGIEVGSALRVRILDVDLERRRITLSQRQADTEV
ncbi:S1 RNA-binding domain-containing protein [Streptomyces sp. NPDC102451]|uniref:S1 RNA-binding domain-containing protein n=1 Tax=Streptomyces sp. NPDC102451 TaxID=3366177 RepID=UPI00382516C2